MIHNIVDTNIEDRALASEFGEIIRLWNSSQISGRAPYALFSPENNRAYSRDLFVMIPVEDNDYIYAHFGENIAMQRGFDHTGMRASDIKPVSLASELRLIYQRALADNKPIFFLQRTDEDQHVNVWERIVLPCIDPDGQDLLVILNKPRAYRVDLLGAIMDATQDCIIATHHIFDEDDNIVDGTIRIANRRACKAIGRAHQDVIGQRVKTLFPHLQDADVWRQHVQMLEMDRDSQFELCFMINGKPMWMHYKISPIPEGGLIAFNDINQQKQLEEERARDRQQLEAANASLAAEIQRRKALEDELRALAAIDPLTGLQNRRSITEAITRAMAQAERFGHGLSLVAMDLDHFKRINSQFGHSGGDQVLKSVSRLFSYGLREDIDTVGRMGGEEFLAVLPNTTLEGAVTISERLRLRFESFAIPYEGKTIRFTASFGVCDWNGRESIDDVCKRADQALMQAKKAGRNIVVVDTGGGNRVTMRRVSQDAAEPAEPELPSIANETMVPESPPKAAMPKKLRLKSPKKSS